MRGKVSSKWKTAILVCRKCSKKLKGGFGLEGDQHLAKALRKHLNLGKGRKAAVGVIEVGCLDLCPKGAVTVINGSESREWLLVRPGADMASLAGELGLTEAG